jgi:hypothetical protein
VAPEVAGSNPVTHTGTQPRHAAVAQRQEQRIPNPPVEGSSPSSRAKQIHPTRAGSSVDKSGSLRNSVTRRFKSCSAHTYTYMVRWRSGSAPPCRGGGHGFEPRTNRQGRSRAPGLCWDRGRGVERVARRTPHHLTLSEVAQLAEQAAVHRTAEGSNPSLGANVDSAVAGEVRAVAVVRGFGDDDVDDDNPLPDMPAV